MTLYRRVFDALVERKVDFDVIGLSYYSYWHGTINQFRNNMNDVSARYGKDVVVAEASYAYTLQDSDLTANLFTEGQQKPGGYKATLQGQANAIRDVIEAVNKVPKGRGMEFSIGSRNGTRCRARAGQRARATPGTIRRCSIRRVTRFHR